MGGVTAEEPLRIDGTGRVGPVDRVALASPGVKALVGNDVLVGVGDLEDGAEVILSS